MMGHLSYKRGLLGYIKTDKGLLQKKNIIQQLLHLLAYSYGGSNEINVIGDGVIFDITSSEFTSFKRMNL